ncbi:peptidoglycan DD-metalloendopeptidase family protein [Ningiella sp. W23]|uniref:peptidoglycan DD-metalloendopeptidase family protein n=1 Tax=Ningiella sp. W23 TaxID=3023715 RepID=UPI003756378A
MIHNTIKHLPKIHRLTLGALAAILCIMLLWPNDGVRASRNVEVLELVPGVQYDVPMPSFGEDISFDPEQFKGEEYIRHLVRSGDTLGKILSSHGQSARVTHLVSHSGDEAKRLRKLRVGESLYLQIDASQTLTSIKYPISSTETLYLTRDEDSFISSIEQKPVESLITFAQGTISSSFWHAGVQAGLTDNKIMELASIFGWDIDFAQEIRSGDSFNMAFEELYVDGEFIGYGDIVAAEFVNQGDTFTAIQYSDGNYYTPEGRSMRKSFLRAPVNFRHVSSNFNPKRFHPVQKRIKPHRGVDYVAAVGTPVLAAGDGKVIKAAYDRFNGHHVFIQHGERYQTKYLHFKNRAVKRGDTVKQGQVIGYLGSTGMVTGAHLHYEFLVDGVHRNPRTVELPKAEPIDEKEKDKFLSLAQQTLTLLDNNKRIMLAMN